MKSNLTDELRINMGGKRPEDIYVLLSKDGSTIVRDPGLSRPWHTTNKTYAEAKAVRVGHGCVAVDLLTALGSVLKHIKNLPPGMKAGYKLPDFDGPA